VLLSVDGANDEKLKKWKPALVTASISAQFRTASEDEVVEDAAAAVEAYSDLLTVRSVEDARKRLKAAKGNAAKEAEIEAEIAALLDQIQDDHIRKLLSDEK
jgi:predicted TPR repeat methyltransferase